MPMLFPNFGGGPGAGGGGGSAPLSAFAGDFSTLPWDAAISGVPGIYSAANQKTYLSWRAEGGPPVIRIVSIDKTTGQASAPTTIDTSKLVDDIHDAPSLCELSDGRVLACYGAHGGVSNNVEWSISAANDVTSWTKQSNINGSYTYPKAINIPDGSGGGTVYLFVRDNLRYGTVHTATYTALGAVSFGAGKRLIDFTDRFYAANIADDGSGDIEMMAVWGNTSVTQLRHVYYFRYKVATGAVENLSGAVSVASASQPVTLLQANADFREFDTGTNDSTSAPWARDTNGNLHVLFFNGTSDAGVTYNLQHAFHNGTSWSAPTTIAALATLGPPKHLRVGIIAGAAGKVEAWYPKGQAGGWTVFGGDDMVRRVWNGSTWGAEETIVTGDGSTALAVPHRVELADASVRVAFTEAAQSEVHGGRALLKRYGHGDNGFVQFPDLNDPLWPYVVEQHNFASALDDESWVKQPVTAFGNAQLSGGRLVLDGAGDYLRVGTANVQASRRYNFGADGRTGAFMVEFWDITWDTVASTTQAIWARFGLSGNRSLAFWYRTDLGSPQIRMEMSFNGSAVTPLGWVFTPTAGVIYPYLSFSRDDAGIARIHFAESGSTAPMRASANVGTTALASSSEAGLVGAYRSGQLPMHGKMKALRITEHARSVSDADIAVPTLPLSIN